jgi:Icc-related predicted phosphoesterase
VIRILHVTDFHFRFYPTPSWFEWLVRESFVVDAVAFTGDFLDLDKAAEYPTMSYARQSEMVFDLLATFPRPLFCCSGNHDFELGSSRPPSFLLDAARSNTNVRTDGADEIFGGVRFVSFGWGRVPVSLPALEDACPTVILSHAPPAGTLVSTTGRIGDMGDCGDFNLRRISGELPKGSAVLCGHQHARRRWYARVADTLCFNPGYEKRRFPNRILLEFDELGWRSAALQSGESSWDEQSLVRMA